mmetsp:Transcript_15614/g.36549  ORF Transcript_15614/g.36549 Transcript_15614/m.36549 type:complete len:287 (+) Transcript_15614:2466-3326(+)
MTSCRNMVFVQSASSKMAKHLLVMSHLRNRTSFSDSLAFTASASLKVPFSPIAAPVSTSLSLPFCTWMMAIRTACVLFTAATASTLEAKVCTDCAWVAVNANLVSDVFPSKAEAIRSTAWLVTVLSTSHSSLRVLLASIAEAMAMTPSSVSGGFLSNRNVSNTLLTISAAAISEAPALPTWLDPRCSSRRELFLPCKHLPSSEAPLSPIRLPERPRLRRRVFFSRALAKALAPASPILLECSSRMISPTLMESASAIFSAPSLPMEFRLRSSDCRLLLTSNAFART